MRKLKTILMSAALGVGLAAGAAQAQERVFFGIATGGTGGTYYPLGGMLAQVISNNADLEGKKLSATAETGNASVANAGLLGRGDIESAFVAADILDSAYQGKNQFEGKAQKTYAPWVLSIPKRSNWLPNLSLIPSVTWKVSPLAPVPPAPVSGNCWGIFWKLTA